MMIRFLNTLNKKVIAFLILVLGASLAITIFFSIRMERLNALRAAKDKVQSFAEVVQINICQAMKEEQGKNITAIIRTLALPKEVMMVRIFDHERRVVALSKEESKEEISLPPNLRQAEDGTVLTQSHRGERILSTLKPFYNEAQCFRCHGKDKKILGYLNVDFSLVSLEDQLRSYTNLQILSGFGILLMMSTAMFIFFSRSINKPILDVSRKMSEVENGNFAVQAPIRTRDELGHLAQSFNMMVKNLQEMREREEQHRLILMRVNESLQEKIQELNVLYESTRAINESLRLEEILRLTIENVTRSLGFDRVVLTVFDEKKETLTGKLSIGIDEEIVRQVHIPMEEMRGVLNETIKKREPVLVRDTSIYPIIERREAKKCWEVMDCQYKTCPIYGSNELRCWMIKGTRCDLEMKGDTFEEKMRICGKCPYLKEIVKRSDIVNLLLFGSHSFISVPLMAREKMQGILLADKLRTEKEITGEDIKLLMTFLSHASVAIENATLYQRLERKVDLSQKQLQETNEQLKKRLEELSEIRRFNESILQNLYGGIVTYNKEGTVTFMNRSGAELLGWEEREVLGRSIDEVLYSPNGKTSIFHKFLDGNGDLSGETEIKKREGKMIPVEVFLSHLQDHEGNITGVTGIFRDISEKREIEARMRRMDKLASLGQLASGIAHEIKNPLAGIGSAVQVLSSSVQFDDSKKQVVKEVLKQIQRLDGTIKNLLRFAKPEKPNLAPNDLNEIIETVMFLVSQQAKKQNIQIHLDLKKDLPKVMIDPQQVQQAILNVVLNAAEAMPSGGTLTFSSKEIVTTDPSKKEKKPYASLIISDTGTGMSEGVMAQIFNPFYTTKPAGTGLGLSITQRIIEQHNGRIDIKSEVGKGTSFTIDLPTSPSPHRGGGKGEGDT
ncbi:MAG: ATP-binding protein [Thermodesulfobacteriota bacterium]